MMYPNYQPTDKPDLQLVKEIRKGDSEAFEEVCRRYEKVFYDICQKYVPALANSGVNPNDIFEEKNCLIYHCVGNFDPSKKTKLSTHIGNYARYLCLNSINQRRFIMPTTDGEIQKIIEDGQAKTTFLQNNSHSKETYNYILNLIAQLKDPRIEEIFKYRYLVQKRLIWTEISKRMGISTQTAINLHNKGLNLLRRKMKSPLISDVI